MDIDRLFELLHQGEGLTLEFKESLPGNATKVAEILCSFCNCSGGTLLVGVTDDGRASGVSNPDEVQQRLVSISQNICRPPLDAPQMGSIRVEEGKYVVWVNVTPLDRGLCFVEGRCYIRVGPTSVPITAHEQLEAVLRRKPTPSEQRATLAQQRIVGLRFADPNVGFKDREEKLAEVRKLLKEQRSVKLISILGRGGIGKTALLSKICVEIENGELKLPEAAEALGADGILYYSCRGTDTPFVGRLFGDFGKLLGSPSAEELMDCWRDATQTITDKIRFLLSKLRSGCYLLVLDNLEGLLGDDCRFANPDLAIFFDVALTTAHSLRVLATGRQQPLFDCAAIRSIRSIPLDNGLPEREAVALLKELDPSGDLGLGTGSEDVLLSVGRRCYGIPRALEAFVGILLADPSLTPINLLANASLFEAQVVENLVADHYRRLSEGQRRVVEAIALLNKPVPSTAIAYVLSVFPPTVSVEACLRSLVHQYAVNYHRSVNLYSLHPLDQEHAYGRIPACCEGYNKKALHQRAADYYLDSQCRPVSECTRTGLINRFIGISA